MIEHIWSAASLVAVAIMALAVAFQHRARQRDRAAVAAASVEVTSLQARYEALIDLAEAKSALAHSQLDELNAALTASDDFLVVYGVDGRIRHASEMARAALGLEPGERGGIEVALDDTSRRVYRHEVLPDLIMGTPWKGEMTFARNGLEIPVSATFASHTDTEGRLVRLTMTAHDISELRAMHSVLDRHVHHDALTGLPNRRLLDELLDDALAVYPDRTAVLSVDLDEFKAVNDLYGHECGDELLLAVARVLRACVRPSDVVARVGSDEFIVLLVGVDERIARDVTGRILDRLSLPLGLRHLDLSISASIGVHLADTADTAAGALMAAEHAMQQVKANGKRSARMSTER